jgi:hypothetical protein
MTFNLGSIGPDVHATAEADGWWLRPGADLQCDLRRRGGWPANTLQTPEGITAALQIEALLDLEIADSIGTGIAVRWQRFSDVLREDVALPRRWTTWSPLMLVIDAASQIGRPDFEYQYQFCLGGREVLVDRIGYFIRRRATQQLFHLDEQTFVLVDAMDGFNALGPEQRKAQGWITFASVRGCAESVGAALDSYLVANDVVIPSQIGLDIYTHSDGSISFVPKSPGLPVQEFREAFFRNAEAQDLYTIDGIDGRRVRVVLNDGQRQVLDRMKQATRLRGADKEEATRNPAKYFDGLLDSVEIEYGPRVIGVGEFEFRPVPTDPRERVGFLTPPPPDVDHVPAEGLVGKTRPSRQETEITVRGQEGKGSVRLVFPNAGAVAAAREQMADALARADSGLVLNGETVAVSQEALDALSRDPIPALGDNHSGNGQGKRFLLVYTNETETLDADQRAAVRAARPAPRPTDLRLPNALTPGLDLKPHQRDGLLWLQCCHALGPDRRGVLLADDMGLGKTRQILVHLGRLIEDGALRVDGESTDHGAPWRPILIIAPLILVEDETWQQEIRKCFVHEGDLFEPVLPLHGPGIEKVRVDKVRGQETVLGRPILDADKLMQYRTVITNYETVVNYQHSLAQLKDGRPLWAAVVTDEAQRYKVPNTKVSHAIKAIATDFRIASTGTPVENRLLDLWNIVDSIQPALLGDEREFSDEFERSSGTDQADEALAVLRRRLLYGQPNAFLIRRTKKELPELPSKTDELLYCDMSRAEVAAHQELLSVLADERRAGRHLTVLHRLADLYQHPVVLRGDGTSLPPEQLLAESSKLRAVVAKLHDIRRSGQKAIIFARLLEVQQILAQVFEHEFRQPAPIINGATSRGRGYHNSTASTGRAKDARKRILQEFRDRPGFGLIILSPHVAGIGLTITEANHVFHYGRWWNPAVESQATDRAYRIGQTKPVTVYIPILRDPTGTVPASFDQRLHELMLRKTSLAQDFLHPSDEESQHASDLCDVLEADAEGDALTAPGSAFTTASLDRLDPHSFEAAVGALFIAEGHSVVLTAKSGDGGADVLAVRGGQLTLIQTKHSRERTPIDEGALNDLLGACDIYPQKFNVRWRATLVSNAPMTTETVREAERNGVELVPGDRLARRFSEQHVGLGAMTACAGARCATFDEGIHRARRLLATIRT